ncbi:MAG: 7-cyano-7-deazaguanine synthase QueC [Verrucomicrobiota bacterium]
MKRKVVVLLSGGMDSVCALYLAASQYEVLGALSFHYGAKHNDREIPFATFHSNRLGIPHRIIELGFIAETFKSDLLKSGGVIPKGHYEEKTMKATVVPFRNGIMLSIAAGFAESHEADGLVIAAHSGDHAIYPDCREDFMKSMADAIRLGTYAGVDVIRPFIAMTKAGIATRGAELGVDFSKTWSCYVGGETHCGECGTCVERREAFLLAGIPDPTSYLSTGPLPPKPLPV